MSNRKSSSSSYVLTETCIKLMNLIFKISLSRSTNPQNGTPATYGIVRKYMKECIEKEDKLKKYKLGLTAPTFNNASNPSKGVKIGTIVRLTFTTLHKAVQTIEIEQSKKKLVELQQLILKEVSDCASLIAEEELKEIDLKSEYKNLKLIYETWLEENSGTADNNLKISDEPKISEKYNKFFDVVQNTSATTSKELQILVTPKIIEFCEKHKLLGVSKPISLDDVYVNLEDDISIPERIKEKIEQPGLRLLIVGSLGYGKTTFLKQLALSVLKEKTLNRQVPFFVNLREYIDSAKRNTLFDFIANLYGFTEESSKENLQNLFKGNSDNCVFLLDSLDQISDEQSRKLISAIMHFVSQYPNNDYILSTRDSVDISKLENFEILHLQGIKEENKKVDFIRQDRKSVV